MPKIPGLPLAAVLLAGLLSLATPSLSAQAAPSGGCTVRTSPLSPGDSAMDHGNFAKAIDAYRAELASAPDPDRVHDALVRALLAEGRIAEAESDATAWTAKSPASVWAIVALGEVQWRKGDINAAFASLQKALTADTCNPRVHADIAQADRFSAHYLDAKIQLNMAHHLDPVDVDILQEWLSTLPVDTRIDWAQTQIKKPGISDGERAALQKWSDQLSKPADAPCRLVSSVTSATIPYRRIQDGPNAAVFWGLDVGFNGKNRRLEIDTGASGLTLYKGAANALHLNTEETFNTYGVGTQEDVRTTTAKVASIKIGGLEFADCKVHILDVKRDQDRPEDAEDGLIGGDVFSSFLVTLDFPGHVLKLDPLPAIPGEAAEAQNLQTGIENSQSTPHDRYIAPAMSTWTKAFRSGHDLILPVRLDKGPIKLFIVDTGAALNSISPQAAGEVVKVMKGSDVDVIGISGKVQKAFTTMPLTLHFASISQPTSGLTAFDMTRFSDGAGIELSGFLGQPTLHQLTVQIDYRDALMNFTYDPKRLQRCSSNINRTDECF